MQYELGGGDRQRGEGWLNVDRCAGANIQHDLNRIPWPIQSETADAVYSSHCIEHVLHPIAFVREIARICKVGATVEIRCPDALSEMAMVASHESVFSINSVRHLDSVFPELWWTGCERRLRLVRIEPGADDYWFPLARANPLFDKWSDDDILTWLPRTRHENRFHFTVEAMQ